MVKALNSITKVAPNKAAQNYTNAISQNEYFMVFDGDEIVTIFKPSRDIKGYFKDNSEVLKQEIIKRVWL